MPAYIPPHRRDKASRECRSAEFARAQMARAANVAEVLAVSEEVPSRTQGKGEGKSRGRGKSKAEGSGKDKSREEGRGEGKSRGKGMLRTSASDCPPLELGLVSIAGDTAMTLQVANPSKVLLLDVKRRLAVEIGVPVARLLLVDQAAKVFDDDATVVDVVAAQPSGAQITFVVCEASQFARPQCVFVRYASSMDQKVQSVQDAIEKYMPSNGLAVVVASTKRNVDQIELTLFEKGLSVAAIHGSRTQQEREDAFQAFKSHANPILITTSVAMRGLDSPFVDLLIHFEAPQQVDDYVHQISRTCWPFRRHGGFAVTLVNERDKNLMDLNQLLTSQRQELPVWFELLCQNQTQKGSLKTHSDAGAEVTLPTVVEQSEAFARPAATIEQSEAFTRPAATLEVPADSWF